MPFSGIVTGSELMDVTNGSIGNTVSGNLAVSGTLAVTGVATFTASPVFSAAVTSATITTLTITTLTTGAVVTSPVITTGLTASGSAANTFAGSTGTFITSTGTNTLSGNTIFKAIPTPVAATGAGGGVAGAAALGAGNMLYVSSDGATKGVKLLTGVAGDTKWIINTSSTACNLFAASGGTINGGGADVGCAIPASKGVVAFCSATNTWTVFDMPAHAGAAA